MFTSSDTESHVHGRERVHAFARVVVRFSRAMTDDRVREENQFIECVSADVQTRLINSV
jgi:hypothetical protein